MIVKPIAVESAMIKSPIGIIIIRGCISFDNISFNGNNIGTTILNISLTIKAGKSIGKSCTKNSPWCSAGLM